MSAAERVLSTSARLSALFGGLVLLGVVVMSVLSIAGRALVAIGLTPIPGDFELVEAGTALAVFCFLPWCQLTGGHVTVDILKPALGDRVDAALAAFYNLLMTLVAAFILWRAWDGLLDKARYNETTFILQFPVWWGYAVCLPPAALLVVVAAYTTVRALRHAYRPETGA